MQPTLSIVFCWPGISGYMAACWRALAAQPGVRVAILSTPSSKFVDSIVADLDCHVMTSEQEGSRDFVEGWVSQRKPDVVFIGGWAVGSFRALARAKQLAGVPFILGLDNPWQATLRQHLAPMILRGYLSRFSTLLVPGERGWQFGKRLARASIPVVKGLYGIDVDNLTNCLAERNRSPKGWPKKFLFVGRYEHVKAIDTLVEAYRLYRRAVADPWPLTCCGAGPLGSLLVDEAGVTDAGFIQPPDQPAVWRDHGVFVLASRMDPWPLVIAEACAAGLPIVCTDACGSAVELVRQYFNGIVAPTESADELARGLTWMHRNCHLLPTMGQRSQEHAAAFSADMWATRFTELARELSAR
jgi:glycosyltransferase involved in cell wall biosynthesis